MAGKMLPNPGPTPHRGKVRKTSSQTVPNPHKVGPATSVPAKTSSPKVPNPKPNPSAAKAGIRRGK